ncbi:hypothetical protein KDK88_04060 [bacterium]|nr:hypothetical protein [bacterium]
MTPVPFLAAWSDPAGTSWWQILGAFLAVAALLLLTLRLLGRWQAARLPGDVRVLSVASLGPKRALETLRFGQEVLTFYRSEGSMVLLERRPLGPADAPPADGGLLGRLGARLRPSAD